MGGSSGTVSKVTRGPQTGFGEDQRASSMDAIASPGLIESARNVDGVINEVHERLPLVKAYNTLDGTVVAGNRWIRLLHSPEEIVDRFGTIRIGMHVRITYTGPIGEDASAIITLNEGDQIDKVEALPNEKPLGLWEIFA